MTTLSPGKIVITHDHDPNRCIGDLKDDVSEYAAAIVDLVRCLNPELTLKDDTLYYAMQLLSQLTKRVVESH
jgi:hypothetical protein